jgi:predicted phosphodiesterase
MRFLILSDIHANIDAFDTVLASIPAASWDRAVVLGDLVGYGAEPNAVIERVQSLDPLTVIRGNHDRRSVAWPMPATSITSPAPPPSGRRRR